VPVEEHPPGRRPAGLTELPRVQSRSASDGIPCPSRSDGRKAGLLRRRWFRITAYAASVFCVLFVAGAMLLHSRSARSAGQDNERKTTTAENSKQAAENTPLTPQQIAREKQRRKATAMTGFRKQVAPFFKKYCYDCHGSIVQEAGLDLENLKDEQSVFSSRKQWEKIFRMVRTGAMPPEDHEPRPTEKERSRIAEWIDTSIFYIDCRLVDNPGRVTIRRLNRAEYNNTIRDLIGVDFQPAKDFPSDDVGYGFDNIGDVLSLPPLLMEKYLNAAEDITDRAIYVPDPDESAQRRGAKKLNAGRGADRLSGNGFRVLTTNGEVSATFHFPKTGEYELRAEAAADQAGDDTAKMQFRLDGKAVKTFKVTGYRKPAVYKITLKVEKGERTFAAAFTNDYYMPKAKRRRDRDRNLAVRYLEVRGPLGEPANELPEKYRDTHKRMVIATPGRDKSVEQAAREVIAEFLPRAFRRPVTDDEIDKYVRFVTMVVEKGDSFERGVQVAVQAILVSPHFLFRIEDDPARAGAPATESKNGKRRLNDYELASRLSYFLWSSMPDEELFRLAEAGTLHKPEVLKRQVRRMLENEKANALVKNFGSQWLNLRILDDVTPDEDRFPFNNKLRRDMQRETELFFEHVMREDRSILDFLDGRYTFLNERLAQHYGISGVKGDHFRRVDVSDHPRAGVLTHASVLTLTSNPTRTSPVKRGKWILENIFDDPPPDPPPNVPELDEDKIASGELSLRKQLEIHRKNPVCASCHTTMDAIGFGFENFDAVGRFRTNRGHVPIDASGELPDGSTFRGPLELVTVLKQRRDDFSRCFAKKMLTFALGRGLEYYDKCTLDDITKATRKNDYRFSVFVEEIVTSDPFLMRSREGGSP